jgi:hypothetical protein
VGVDWDSGDCAEPDGWELHPCDGEQCLCHRQLRARGQDHQAWGNKLLLRCQVNGSGQSVLLSWSRSRKEPHLLVGAGARAVTQCRSGSNGYGSDNGIKYV